MKNMWKEIMETEIGEEFAEWLEENSMFYYSFLYYEFLIPMDESIINNLAIEWLDKNGYNISVLKRLKDHRVIIQKTHNNYIESVEYFNCDTRQEAISQGVKKAFELLGL